MFKSGPKGFVRRSRTVDGTWIHYCTPETKERSKQWVSSAPMKTKKNSAISWKGYVTDRNTQFIDYLLKGNTITGEYYAALLGRPNNEIANSE